MAHQQHFNEARHRRARKPWKSTPANKLRRQRLSHGCRRDRRTLTAASDGI